MNYGKVCRQCRSRNINPVKVIQCVGKSTRIADFCRNCGAEVRVTWKKNSERKLFYAY